MTENELKIFFNKVIKEKILSYEPIGHHDIKRHLVYLIKTEKKQYVIKMFFVDDRWNREVSALKILNALNFNVQKVLDYGIVDNKEYLIMEFKQGVTLEDSDIEDINTIKIIYYKAGKYLGHIHNKTEFKKYGVLNPDLSFKVGFDTWPEYFIHETSRHLVNWKKWDHPEPEIIRNSIDIFDKQRYRLKGEFKPCLIHNDFSKRNLLLLEDDEVMPIDFEQSSISDKYRELAIIKYDLDIDDPEYFSAFLSGYKEVSDFDSEQFELNKNLYMLAFGISICCWSLEKEPEFYYEGLNILKKLNEHYKK